MATRKTAPPRPRPPSSPEAPASAPRKRAAAPAKERAPRAAAKQAAPRKRAAVAAKKPSRATRPAHSPRPQAGIAVEAVTGDTGPRKRRLSDAERERRFNLMLQAACLKAGTAAAIGTITSKVPLLGRLAPLVLGSVGETLAVAKVHQQLVRETVSLYGIELTDAEERGVILLATAVNIGSQQISKATVEELIEQLSGRLYRPVISRVLPLASVATEVAASVATTYAVGKRAQALCRLPGTGARDLGDFLRGMSGIDQAKLYSLTADAFSLALKPFRGALMAMVPAGLGLVTRRRR